MPPPPPTLPEGDEDVGKWVRQLKWNLRYTKIINIFLGILTWEIYSGGKQPYPAINNTDVVQKVCVSSGQ